VAFGLASAILAGARLAGATAQRIELGGASLLFVHICCGNHSLYPSIP
jgi:hypothetical protein